MDENNNQNNFGSFDNNNNYNPDPINNVPNAYEPFENNMPYEQNNNFESSTQFNQTNNFDSNNLYNLDNNFDNNMNYNSEQYSQPNSFDNTLYSQNNNMQYNQVNDNQNPYQSFDNNSTQYNNMQYEQANDFDTNTQFAQSNNYDNNMQYEQPINYNNTEFDSNPNFNNGINNDSDYSSDFKKAWMGNIYDKAHSRKFNWCSAFFAGTYFMYRKVYLTGLLFVIFYSLLVILPSLMFFGGIIKSTPLYIALSAILPLIFMIISGFIFYPLYRSFVNKKFNTLKSTIADNSALVNEATVKGGTSALGVIIALIVSAIIIFVGIGSTVASSYEKLIGKQPDHDQDDLTNEITEPVTDMKSFNFLNEYSVEYDSLNWFFNPIDNSLTKGNYSLVYSGQYLDDIKNNFNVDVTNSSGRASLLSSLVSSLQTQAAAINLSVELVSNSFVADNDIYYAYLDVISDSAISRYYLVLLPEKDILFQFILSSNDTNIDYATNLEVINILTSLSSEEVNIPDNENGNVIENEVTNQVSNTVAGEVPNELINNSNTISNEIGGDVTNNVNEVTSSSSNVIDVNSTSENNQVPLQSILN